VYLVNLFSYTLSNPSLKSAKVFTLISDLSKLVEFSRSMYDAKHQHCHLYLKFSYSNNMQTEASRICGKTQSVKSVCHKASTTAYCRKLVHCGSENREQFRSRKKTKLRYVKSKQRIMFLTVPGVNKTAKLGLRTSFVKVLQRRRFYLHHFCIRYSVNSI